jgi:hypothetical protein
MSNAAVQTPTAREKMIAFANAQPLPLLCASLLMLDAKPKPGDAERLARAVIIDVICQRCPAADAAFDAWANDETGNRTAVEVIVTAAKGARS